MTLTRIIRPALVTAPMVPRAVVATEHAARSAAVTPRRTLAAGLAAVRAAPLADAIAGALLRAGAAALAASE